MRQHRALSIQEAPLDASAQLLSWMIVPPDLAPVHGHAMLGQSAELAIEEGRDTLFPLHGMGAVRLDVIAPRDHPEVGSRIRARRLQFQTVMREHQIVIRT